MKNAFSVIAFDADDTLWENETYFRESEDRFSDLMSDFSSSEDVLHELLRTEIKNLPSLGYGTKALIISMMQTAIKISNGNIGSDVLLQIIEIGKDQLAKPVLVLEGVKDVLKALQGHYRLVMVTKGDLLEQQTKLQKSGLEPYFHHTEIVTEKTVKEYQKLIKHLDIAPSELLMIGNSMKSDILPVLQTGACAWHVPFHTTWIHETVSVETQHPPIKTFSTLTNILPQLL